MFGGFSPHTLTPSAASLSTTTHAATPTSPTRPSRLRGLSYLRNYTHNHLHHSSPSSPPPSSPSRLALSRSNSTPISAGRQSRAIQPVHSAQPAASAAQSPAQIDQTQAQAPTQTQTHSSPSPQRSSNNNSTTGADSPTSGWVPTVGGQSGLSRVAPQPQPTQADSSTPEPVTMTRRRAATSTEDSASAARSARPDLARGASAAALEPAVTTTEANTAKKDMPTIRLIPHHEPRSSRPSLTFPIVTRTLPTSSTKVRVGRYSERDSGAADALTNPMSTAPVGFKSKVVSRRHCELWCENGQWYIKDVKSSSGTFLNHVRLSSPGLESRAYPVNDGDIIQLGIDFKGGEEQIFRCVKIRVECNRGWQKSLNQFNTSTHKRLLKRTQAGATKDSDAQSTHSSECSICLCPVAPCQALFVAPCSHVWHYKCIRTLIYPNWPSFQCPNCRAYADLEADVDQPEEEEEEEVEDEAFVDAIRLSEEAATQHTTSTSQEDNADEEDLTEMMTSTSVRDTSSSPHPTAESSTSGSGSDGEAEAGPASTATSTPVPIVASTKAPINHALPESIMARSATPTSHTQFALAAGIISDGGPSTPMNDSGPFIFDASRRARPVDDMAREPVREEHEESPA